MTKKLYRNSRTGRVAGVCSGIAEYFDLDVSIVRILAVITVVSGPGVFLYLLAMAFLPNKPFD